MSPVANNPMRRPITAQAPRPGSSINAGADPLAMHRSGVGRPLSAAFNNPEEKKKRRGLFGKRKKDDKKQVPSWKRITKRSALAVVAIFVLMGGWFGWKIFHNASKVFGGPTHVLSAFKAVKLKGEDTGHVNILLAGNSADRTDGNGGGDLTDSIMLVSIDTKNHAASMISIPRDTWVEIPGFGHGKINEAYHDGNSENFNQAGYAKGGMGLLEKVVSQNFGITPNYYALVNYEAFKDAVNKVGGISINVQSRDPRGLYDPSRISPTNRNPLVKLPNGQVSLNGDQALNLARARGDAYGSYGFEQSDFDRTTHQRQMLLALKQKVSSPSVISNPLKISGLMDAIGNNVHTDFQLNEVMSLYAMMKKINSSDIKSISFNNADGKNLLSNYQTPAGASALIPAEGLDDFSAIQAYLAKVITNDPVTKENANVVVLNGAEVNGLAKLEQTALNAKGMNVSDIATAPADRPTSTVIDNSAGKMPATRKLLGSLFGNSFTTDAALTKTYPNAQFIVILGANQQPPAGAASTSSTSSTSVGD